MRKTSYTLAQVQIYTQFVHMHHQRTFGAQQVQVRQCNVGGGVALVGCI